MTKRFKILAVSLLAFLWFVIIVVYYFAAHKPFTPTLALNLSRASGQLIMAFCIAAIAGGIGVRILPTLEIDHLAKLSLQSALGFGLIGNLILFFGSVIGINLFYGWLVLLVLGLIFRNYIIRWIRSWRSLKKKWQDSQRKEKVIGCGVFLILFFTLITSLAPPLKFDALVYHLTLPKIYLNFGRFLYIPENMFWGMPQLGEMLYTLVVAIGGIQTATALGWMFGLLTVTGLFGYIYQRLGSQAAWVAIASLLAGYTLADSLAWGYVDWLAMYFGMAVLICLDKWRLGEGIKVLLLAGVFTGMALGVKYTSGVLVLVGIGIILYQVATVEENRNRTLIFLLSFITPAILLSLPWWIKNLLATGNPFYPFFIAAGSMDLYRINFYHIPRWGNWKDIVFLPIRTTFAGLEGAPGYNASIGPLLLALCPFAYFGWSGRDHEAHTTISTAALVSIIGIAVWVIASQFSAFLIQTRLYLSLFPAFAILAGVGFDSMRKIKLSTIRMGRVVGVVILLVLGLTVVEISVGKIDQGAVKPILGLMKTEDYINDNLGWYGPTMREIRELPSGSEVLMLWEPRSFYCLPKCIPDEILDRWMHDRYIYGDNSSILESWQEAGYSHLLFNRTGADFVREDDVRYSSSDWEVLEELLSELPLVMDLGGAYYLYSLER